jgi:hypothetical protein
MMTGQHRNDPASWTTKTAVMQRWVELASDEAIAWAKVAQNGGDSYYQAAEVFGMVTNIDPRSGDGGRSLRAANVVYTL